MSLLVPTMTMTCSSAKSNDLDGTPLTDPFAIYVIDESPNFRNRIVSLATELGYKSIEFSTSERFLALVQKEPYGLILAGSNCSREDATGRSGLHLLEQIRFLGWGYPVLLFTDSSDVENCSAAYNAGAFAYLPKSINEKDLSEHLVRAAGISDGRKRELQRKSEVAAKLNLLTSREREVLDLIVAGHSMKAIAANSGTSFQAVARHRQRILEKLRLEGDVALVRWFYNLSGM